MGKPKKTVRTTFIQIYVNNKHVDKMLYMYIYIQQMCVLMIV